MSFVLSFSNLSSSFSAFSLSLNSNSKFSFLFCSASSFSFSTLSSSLSLIFAFSSALITLYACIFSSIASKKLWIFLSKLKFILNLNFWRKSSWNLINFIKNKFFFLLYFDLIILCFVLKFIFFFIFFIFFLALFLFFLIRAFFFAFFFSFFLPFDVKNIFISKYLINIVSCIWNWSEVFC